MASTELSRVHALDALRGIAASGVVVFHVAYSVGLAWEPDAGGWFLRLNVCVTIFFILSGFVLFRPYAWAKANGQKASSIGVFYKRRFLRLVPAYWAVVIAAFLIVPAHPPSWQIWVRYLTFTQFYFDSDVLPGIGQSWTLTIEMAYSLLLPFL